jgi:cbb3-type cytochrome oxidase subunit 1
MTSVIEYAFLKDYTVNRNKKRTGGKMDRFVRNFIIVSIVYLGISSILGVCMIGNQSLLPLKFVHSHLNMLGWVSMMIYGVGYHVLPRFAGRPLKHPKIGEIQFWTANIGLIGMLLFYSLNVYNPAGLFQTITVIFGGLEVVSVMLFLYNMLATLLPKTAN